MKREKKRTLILERWIAPKHMGQGSQEAYISQSESSILLSFLHAWTSSIQHENDKAATLRGINTIAAMELHQFKEEIRRKKKNMKNQFEINIERRNEESI